MQVREAMTRNCESMRANESIKSAAQCMRDHDIGAIFVNDDSGSPIGILTDRDIAVRAVADAASADSEIRQFMSKDPVSCYEDQALEEAGQIMEQQQLRRLLVCSRDGKPVGVLAQADLARALGRSELTGEVLKEVSKPGGMHSQSHH